MAYQMLRTGTTFEIISTTTSAVVFTGELAAVMAEFSRLNLAAKGPSITSPRKQRRLDQIAERKQAGR